MSDKTTGDQLASGFFYGLGFWLAGFCVSVTMFVFFVFVLGVGRGIVSKADRQAVETPK